MKRTPSVSCACLDLGLHGSRVWGEFPGAVGREPRKCGRKAKGYAVSCHGMALAGTASTTHLACLEAMGYICTTSPSSEYRAPLSKTSPTADAPGTHPVR